jgi:ribonucleotide reductase alpha subunit
VNSAIDRTNNDLFDFFGLRTLYDRYLLRHPETRDVIETLSISFYVSRADYTSAFLMHWTSTG